MIFERAFADAAGVLDEFRRDPMVLATLDQMADELADCFRRRGRVFSCGNGGSLTDAAHFAEEFSGRFRNDRDPLPAMAFTDPAHLTCVANDYGYEHVFSRMVDAFGHEGDILVLLTTSGRSPNLLRAAEAAKRRGVQVYGFLGKGGGELQPLCDRVVLAPGVTSDRIQELHMLALHALIEAVEARLADGA
ncbi:MAG: SIS domain-containing protein [Methanoregulaceae archaeon]|nr:SIS domain-containing protein [Methanoregulaceae archaeon]